MDDAVVYLCIDFITKEFTTKEKSRATEEEDGWEEYLDWCRQQENTAHE